MDLNKAVLKFGDWKWGILFVTVTSFNLILCKVVCVSSCLDENILESSISSVNESY